ncbi:uncharacterized protein LOC143821071 isoform X2 [Paroedura picta]|uniref:uncharacterized protein LOC143821071 isoform X2 n=1 Tax=Paroedura picta TaxID=143630 RepID=UPI0040578E40
MARCIKKTSLPPSLPQHDQGEGAADSAFLIITLQPKCPPKLIWRGRRFRSWTAEWRQMYTSGSLQVTFEDVAIYFSRQEWAELTGWQKALYWEVMEELYCQLARRLPGRATEGVHRVTSPRPYSGSHDGRPLPKTPAWVRLRRTSLPGEPQEQSLDSRLAG